MTQGFIESVVARHNIHVHGESGPTLVFAHGFGCDQNMWRFVEPAFRERFRTVLFDYVGFGQSDTTAFDAGKYASLDGYARDLAEVVSAVGAENAIVVGHSVSSMIALLAAIRAPERIGAIVMIGPSPRYINDAPGYVGGFEQADIDGLLDMMDHNFMGWAGTLAPVVMGNAERPELTAELQASFCSTDPVVAKCFARATFYADNRADLGKVSLPVLVMQVRDDAVAPQSVGRYVHERLPGSQHVVLDATGHCPHMSHPQLTIEAMRPFLEKMAA
jgi:sigma-B regulation protein RsbQ